MQRNHSVVEANDEHNRPFQTFGLVDGGQRHKVPKRLLIATLRLSHKLEEALQVAQTLSIGFRRGVEIATEQQQQCENHSQESKQVALTRISAVDAPPLPCD